MYKIIIIEDEAMIALDLSNTLTKLGYKVVGKAMNGDKALDVLANTPCDLILLDIHIKGTLNGIDLAHLINEKYHVPFIYITSFTDTYTLEQASKTMPYGYIVKPFTEKDLKSNISMALARSNSEKVKLDGMDFSEFENKYDFKLSDREIDIMVLFLKGATYKETATSLEISVNTVKTYQKRIFQKFKVESKVQLINMIKG